VSASVPVPIPVPVPAPESQAVGSLPDGKTPGLMGTRSGSAVDDGRALRLPPFLTGRPRLEERLDAIPRGGVGLVVAPAGSGKSVLMGQWMRRSIAPACLLRLTTAHGDPSVFAPALTTTVATAAPGFDLAASDLVAVGPGLGPVFTSRLLVELEELGTDLALVLDDAHLVSSPAILGDLADLLGHLPDNVRVVVGSRWDLPLGMPRLRLEGRLVEIRMADLALDLDEARCLVEAVAERPLTPGQLTTLVDRTDGWAAGLQLAAVSLQRAAEVDALIDGFAGTDQLVAEYLTEEVLDDIEPEVRRFLLHTSVLESLETELCDAVTGDGDADRMLDLLTRRSLFLIRPESPGEPPRYHHLFADLLRYRLDVAEPDATRRLRLVAARWLLSHDRVTEGIEQLLAARAPRNVLQAVVDHGARFFEREQSATLARWLDAARTLDGHPPAALEVNLLAAQVASHQTAPAIETYRRLRGRPLTLGETAAATALYATLGLDDLPSAEVRGAVDEARGLLARHGDADVVDFLGVGGRGSVETFVGFMDAVASLHDDELTEAIRRFSAVLGLPGTQYGIWKVYSLGGLAFARAMAGECLEARASGAAAVDVAEAMGVPRHYSLAFAHLALGRVAVDALDGDGATRHLQLAAGLAQRMGRTSFTVLQQLLQVEQTALWRGTSVALAELRRSSHGGLGPALAMRHTRAQELRLLIAEGRLGQARSLLTRFGPAPHLAPQVIDLELAAGDVAAARAALDDWMPPRSIVRAMVEHALRRSAVAAAEDRTPAARRALQEALDLAEPVGLRLPFLEQPSALVLLRAEAGRGSQAFARSVLAGRAAADARTSAQARLVEPLTDREREVLDYLPTRLTNRDMAASLFVSVNTLKTHLGHIYAKLGVTDRDEAVARASELGLL
jgi:LuxR family transcriptional regulator, maltose regulon positive regulatory protein